MVANGQFREDLLYRLRVIHIHVPPLRERREDIRAARASILVVEGRAQPVEFSTRPRCKLLERYRWPGNVRELQNVVEQSLWMSNGSRVEVAHLPPSVQASADDVLLPMQASGASRWPTSCITALVSGGYSFWEHIHPLFLARDITRHDMRELVRQGLATTRGNYRCAAAAVRHATRRLQAVPEFPGRARLHVDFREFRHGSPPAAARAAAAAAARGPQRHSSGVPGSGRP